MSRTVIVVVLTLLLTADAGANVRLVNNGYEGIVVAITDSLPPSQTAIDRIKKFFTDASLDLFLATHKRVYFRNITILVPKHWGNMAVYNTATTETFDTAEIRIDGLGRGSMSTRSFGSCGAGGLFITIPKIYMTANQATLNRTYGPPGRTIAHEWGHFRWGLFDEYPVTKEDYASFYHGSSGSVEAVKCGMNLNGVNEDSVTHGGCTSDPNTGLPTKTCFFLEDKANPGVTASLMDYHWIPKVTTFCDSNVNDPATLHNVAAPSKHNDKCRHKSCWDVMRQHMDFRNGNSPSLPSSHNTRPTFRIVQGKNVQYVLVLDVSGSMSTRSQGVSRIETLRLTAADFLLNAVPLEYYVGIVTFSSGARMAAPLTKITNDSVRQTLAAMLPGRASGGTNIKSGLQKGLQVLGSSGGGTLILVSDGQDSSGYLRSMTPVLRQKSVRVHTILIGYQADADLTNLAANTGGTSFFANGNLDTTDLMSAFRSTGTDEGSATPGAAPVEILLESLWVDPKKEVTQSVLIDSSVSRDTEFSFSYTGAIFTLDVVVISPSGVNYTVDGPNGRNVIVTKQMTISIKNETEVGTWTVILRNPSNTRTRTQFHVTSKAPSDDSYPIRMWTHLSQQEVDFNDPSTLTMIVRVDLRKGYEPVIGANVEIQVGSLPWKPMKDDGLGVDVTRDDGFYSVALMKFPDNGKFPLRVRATAKDGDRTQLLVGGGTQSIYRPDEEAEEPGPTYEAVGQFQRIKAAGLLEVVNLTPTTDLYALYPFPPAEVRDLRFSAMSYENKTVTLQWTAVGDYAEEETASSYDIRFSEDIKELLYSFENTSQLDDSDVMKGNLSSPSPPSEMETFVIRFRPEYMNTTLFFGLKVTHSRGRISDVSNIESMAIVFVPPVFVPPVFVPPVFVPPVFVPPEVSPTREPGEHGGVFTTVVLVGIACAVVVLVLIIVALLLARKRCKRSSVAAQQDNAA